MTRLGEAPINAVVPLGHQMRYQFVHNDRIADIDIRVRCGALSFARYDKKYIIFLQEIDTPVADVAIIKPAQ